MGGVGRERREERGIKGRRVYAFWSMPGRWGTGGAADGDKKKNVYFWNTDARDLLLVFVSFSLLSFV